MNTHRDEVADNMGRCVNWVVVVGLVGSLPRRGNGGGGSGVGIEVCSYAHCGARQQPRGMRIVAPPLPYRVHAARK